MHGVRERFIEIVSSPCRMSQTDGNKSRLLTALSTAPMLSPTPRSHQVSPTAIPAPLLVGPALVPDSLSRNLPRCGVR